MRKRALGAGRVDGGKSSCIGELFFVLGKVNLPNRIIHNADN